MISRLDRLQGRDIYENTALAKLNEVIDAVNKHEDIIRQIGEWGSSKGECLWCDTLTEFNPEKPQKETFVSIDEALKMGKKVATMQNKSIWHTADEKPMLQRDIILCGDGWSMPMDIIPETVNNICWKNVEKWCYVDDLIKENDHTRKALDVAINAMKSAGTHNSINCIARGEDPSKDDVGITINHALEQITALEQKD